MANLDTDIVKINMMKLITFSLTTDNKKNILVYGKIAVFLQGITTTSKKQQQTHKIFC